mgnify:CR=1 FL=1
MTTQTITREYQLADVPFTKTLFEGKAFAWLWLAIRLYLGYQWIESGWGKITNPAWMQGGSLLPRPVCTKACWSQIKSW